MPANIKHITDMLRTCGEVDARIREIFIKVCDKEPQGACAGFGLSWFFDSSVGKDYVDVVYTNGKTTGAVQFPMEWLDPATNLYTISKDEYRKVF